MTTTTDEIYWEIEVKYYSTGWGGKCTNQIRFIRNFEEVKEALIDLWKSYKAYADNGEKQLCETIKKHFWTDGYIVKAPTLTTVSKSTIPISPELIESLTNG